MDPDGKSDRESDNARLIEIKNRELEAAHAQLEETVAELEERNRQLEEFARIVSHDLKSPLRGIIYMSEWVKRALGDQVDPKVAERLGVVVDSANRLHVLIDGVLAYSRAAWMHPELQVVDTERVVRTVIAGLHKPEKVNVEVRSPLPRLSWDPLQVSQIFQNLIANALRFVDAASGTVVVAFSREERGPVFRVTDDGVGIAPEHHERIFKVFQSLETPGTHDGAGVGLSIVQRLVEARGGRVWVESEPGSGASFAFSVPDDALVD